MGQQPDDERRRFEEIYEAHYDAVARYALRRTDCPDDVVDVLGETFLTAWRRLEDVPPGEGTRPWLYGVARRVLANHRRGAARRHLLTTKLRAEFAEARPVDAGERDEVRAALQRLSSDDRELLFLAGWEGLSAGQIAKVLDCAGAPYGCGCTAHAGDSLVSWPWKGWTWNATALARSPLPKGVFDEYRRRHQERRAGPSGAASW